MRGYKKFASTTNNDTFFWLIGVNRERASFKRYGPTVFVRYMYILYEINMEYSAYIAILVLHKRRTDI